MNRVATLAAIAIAVATAAGPLSTQASQPYAGWQTRSIKALSDEQIAELRAGRGMGLALAAELNGYPGPVHVLDLADPLQLSEQQRAKMEELFEAMKAETVPLGERLLALEAELDQKFAEKTITEESLTAAMQAIGTTQAALRTAHLRYHLAAVEILSPRQIAQYAELRGYSSDAHGGQQHSGHRH